MGRTDRQFQVAGLGAIGPRGAALGLILLAFLLLPLLFVMGCLGVALLYAAILGPILFVISKLFTGNPARRSS